MPIEFELNGTTTADARFITYAPSPARLRLVGGTGPLAVTLSSKKANAAGGEAVFFTQPTAASQATLALTLPADGSWVGFFVGGKWGSPSTAKDDCRLDVKHASGTESFTCMVRLRKNADKLSPAERDRFLDALAKMNASGLYQAFRNVHVGEADDQAHGGPYFLPWHRAYLLDLERELQLIDPEVALPYWKFDEKAPALFSADFLGATRRATTLNATEQQVTLKAGHLLAGWVINQRPGIWRTSRFNTLTEAAKGVPGFELRNQTDTLAMGTTFWPFARPGALEGTPHGAAHVSFIGPLDNPSTAPEDPLFYLLHCNVDRLWALWQWLRKLRDPANASAYLNLPAQPIGWKLADTMWPWDQDQQPPRPTTIPPPRPALAGSPTADAPGPQPKIQDMIDADGLWRPAGRLGFGYDDVPYEG